MYSDFTMVAFSEIFHCVSKWRYMHGPEYKLPLVIRSASGSSNGAGSEHSNTVESLFMHAPGLTIITPSCALRRQGPAEVRHPQRQPRAVLRAKAALSGQAGDPRRYLQLRLHHPHRCGGRKAPRQGCDAGGGGTHGSPCAGGRGKAGRRGH